MRSFASILVAASVCVAVPFVSNSPAAQETPATMKAVRFQRFGGPEVLSYEDAPRPEPKAGEVLVRVHAAGVNPVDWKVRAGHLKGLNPSLPQIPGFDVAGVVERVGEGVERWKAGDEVFSYLSLRRGGGYAEYVVLRDDEVALKPAKIDFVAAAAVPLAALTAWQALFETAELSEGQTVLVHAGAGGVGHFAVQLAKAKGAKVIATASERNHEFLRRLGADVVIDYRTQKFEELVRDADVVLDTIGEDTLERSYGVLKEGGIVVSIVGRPDKAKLEPLGLRGANILVRPEPEQLAEIAALIDAGKLRPEVGEVLPLADARRAQELSEAGHVRGKLVLEVVPRSSKSK
jgi:NADPH:quinone reductase-like Zn-dependent oxidoreductase